MANGVANEENQNVMAAPNIQHRPKSGLPATGQQQSGNSISGIIKTFSQVSFQPAGHRPQKNFIQKNKEQLSKQQSKRNI